MTSLSVSPPPGSSTVPTVAHRQLTPEPTDSHGQQTRYDPQQQQPQQQRPDESVLTFTAVPSDLFQLSFDTPTSTISSTSFLTPVANQHSARRSRSKTSTPTSTTNDSSPTITNTPSTTTTTITPNSQSKHPQPRKPSPGLAARLKALGFGNSRSKSPPSASGNDRVGRLPEEQIRKLDQGHQSSTANPAVERRGRPWKGVVRISSRSSLKASSLLNWTESRESAASDALPVSDSGAEAIVDSQPVLLPEIATSQPLAMDTQKYRLPDHTNGNGVKVQLETREEHLARDTRPPPSDDVPPPPPAKDTPPLTPPVSQAQHSDVFNPDSESYFNPLGLQRPGSIYTLSRASFANQLAQLTSLQLPDAESLSSKVSAIPTAQAATRALIGAAEQIRGWIYKATEVIGGLESEDDVEWAAAGGREGVEEVENAIVRFEELINVYVCAIEELQSRTDIANVSTDDLNRAVAQMEAIMNEWTSIRTTLHSVKGQVEIAMEWEELWNNVLGDIQNEMDELIRLVFEMEERRHKSIMAVANGDGVDIGDLETIVEETPPAAARLKAVNNRFSLPAFPVSPGSPSPGAAPTMTQDDSSLLALFARMQPLRASLDFLPMRLSVFEARAERTFPTSCEELEMRRWGLDANYKKLEKDAESLRKELGEDRWVLVFRGAGRQAQKMYESVEKSVSRLKEAVDAGMHLTNQPMMSKKLENYEGKKTHYGPAIERVLGIIDKGVKDRLTVNGEILRLHAEMQAKWEELKQRMAEMDVALEEVYQDKQSQQLRDSISSMLSNDRSTVASGHDTPGSSPPSSVIMQSLGLPKPKSAISNTKQRSASSSQLPQPNARRLSSLPTPAGQITRKPLASRMSTVGAPSREGSATPTGSRGIPRPNSVLGNRPRWNGGFTNTSDVDTGHNFKPLTLTTPSPYAKTSLTPTPVRSVSSLTPASTKLPTRSPLSRASSSSPHPDSTKPTTTKHLSFRERLASPGPQNTGKPPQPPRLAPASSMSALANRRASFQPPRPLEESPDATPRPSTSMARPASSLASNPRRTSLLPQPKSNPNRTSLTGRESPQAIAGARSAMRTSSTSSSAEGRAKDARPRWRGGK